jgi:DNA-directed RNA polymerase sigma subunit (sigma70/sigma32)
MNLESATPAQRLWAGIFRRPIEEAPALDEQKVLALIASLFDLRERMAVRLRFGFEGTPMTMEEIGGRLPRADGGIGVSRQMAAEILERALEHLRHSDRRRVWKEARTG